MRIKWLLYTLLASSIIFVSCYDDPVDQRDPQVKPADEFLGDNTIIGSIRGCADLEVEDITLYVKTPDNTIIKRRGIHRSLAKEQSELLLDHGLADGNYQLLYIEYESKDGGDEDNICQRGIGCRISLNGGEMTVASTWNETLEMYGSGTEVDTIYISSADHMLKLAAVVNDARTNSYVNGSLYFKQVCNLNGRKMSSDASMGRGWVPIGAYYTTPFCATFDGGGYSINNLYANRPSTYVMGLFGFTYGACIRDVNIIGANINGDLGVGGIVGVATANEQYPKGTFVHNCQVTDSTISGVEESIGVGGIVGIVDEFASINMLECRSVDNTVSATSNAGGIVGAGSRRSKVVVNKCENNSYVESSYNTAGGVVGVCDTLMATMCINRGEVRGSTKFQSLDEQNMRTGLGTGGIAGGTGIAYIVACENHGSIQGYEGVGGITGSARVSGSLDEDDEGLIYNEVMIVHSTNNASVSGKQIVGGISGEGQFASYGCVNYGDVTAEGDYVSGIVAAGASACVYNSLNKGAISGNSYVSGVLSVGGNASIVACQNYGYINALNSHAAGLVGITRGATAINYCANFGKVEGEAGTAMGLVVAEGGQQDEWSALRIVTVIYAGVEAVTGIVINGMSLGVAHSAKFKTPKGETIGHVLDIISLGFGVGFSLIDTVALGFGISDIVDMAKFNAELDEASDELLAYIKEHEDEIDLIRDQETFPDHNINVSLLDKMYNDYLDELSQYFTDEEKADQFTYEVAVSLEKRRDLIEDIVMGKEITHKCISGLAIICGAVSTVIAGIATFGAAVPAAVATFGSVVGIVGAVVGGANTIWDEITSDVPNVYIVSQTVAGGELDSNGDNSNAGGVVGVLNDYCSIEDCINVGTGCAGGGHLVGTMHNSSNMQNCITVVPVDAWGSEGMYSDIRNRATVSGLYYCTNPYAANATAMTYGETRAMSDATGLSLEELRDPSNYKGWDFDNDKGRWIMPADESGYIFPVPYISRYTFSSDAQ